jgi:hypothetical protein
MARSPIAAFAAGTVLTLTTAPQVVGAIVAPQSQVYVTVVAHGLTSPLVTYRDESSSAVLTQPLLTSVDGTVPGWLDIGDLSAAGADLLLALPGGDQTVVLVPPGVVGSGGSSSSIDGGSFASSGTGNLDGGSL